MHPLKCIQNKNVQQLFINTYTIRKNYYKIIWNNMMYVNIKFKFANVILI